MAEQILTQGQNYKDPAGRTGIVNFDTATGAKLGEGATTFAMPKDLNTMDASKVGGAAITTPIVSPYTSAGGALEAIGNLNEANKTALIEKDKADAEAAKLEAEQSKDKTGIQSIYEKLSGENAKKEDLYKAGGVDVARKNVDELTSQIEAEQLATNHKIDLLDKNEGGGLAGSVANEKARIQRESLSKLADLSIVQNAALRKYNTMKDIADRQVDAETETLKTELDGLKFFYAENKSNLDKKEQRAYEEKIKEKDRLYNDAQDKLKSIQAVKLEAAKNGAGVDAISALSKVDYTKPDAFDQALKIAGPFLATANNEIVKLGDNAVLIDKRTGKIIKSYGTGGGGGGGSGIPSSIVQTVNIDGKSKPKIGYTLTAGDDPYFIAKQNGTDMETLKKYNPDIKDWTTLQPGATINLPSTQDNWLTGKTQKQIDAYNQIPDTEKAGIKDLVNGEILMADYVKSRGKTTKAQIDQVLTQAHSVDPNFSVNDNKQRYSFKQTKWNNGKLFDNRTSINTALGHMATLYDSSKELGNSTLPAWNSIANWTSKNAGNPALTNFVYDLTVLSSEIASAYKGGTAPTDQETEKIYESLSSSFSPEQFKAVLGQSTKLMASKLNSLSQEYKNVMGSYPDEPVIQRNILQELKDAGVETSEIDKVLGEQGYELPKDTLKLNIGGDSIINTITSSKNSLGLFK